MCHLLEAGQEPQKEPVSVMVITLINLQNNVQHTSREVTIDIHVACLFLGTKELWGC